jgi:hypothetical protein
MTNVTTQDPKEVSIGAYSTANITLNNSNLPLYDDSNTNVNVSGQPNAAIQPNSYVDCSLAYPDFPSQYSALGANPDSVDQ